MKKLMCALMALLLTIGLCNLDVVKIQASDEEEEKKEETSFKIIQDNTISCDFSEALKQSNLSSSFNHS